jgi:pink-eyed dilution protein, putative
MDSVNGVNRFDLIANYFRYSRSSYHQYINEKIPLIGTGSMFIPNYVNSGSLDQGMEISNCEKPCDKYTRPVETRWSGWRTLKSTLLTLVVLFTLICFIFVKEKQEDSSVITIKQTEPKYINLTNELNIMSPVWTIRAKGPFIPPYLDNLSDFDVYFSIVKISKNGFKNLVRGPWSVPIAPVNSYSKAENIEVEHSFNMRPSDLLEGYDKAYDYQLKIATTQEDHTVFSINISTYTELTVQRILMSFIVLVFLYFLIIFDVVQRTLAAMIGATAAIACLSLINNVFTLLTL